MELQGAGRQPLLLLRPRYASLGLSPSTSRLACCSACFQSATHTLAPCTGTDGERFSSRTKACDAYLEGEGEDGVEPSALASARPAGLPLDEEEDDEVIEVDSGMEDAESEPQPDPEPEPAKTAAAAKAAADRVASMLQKAAERRARLLKVKTDENTEAVAGAVAEAAAPPAAPAPAPELEPQLQPDPQPQPQPQPQLEHGSFVTLIDCTGKWQTLNGLRGRLETFEPDTGRWNVLLFSSPPPECLGGWNVVAAAPSLLSRHRDKKGKMKQWPWPEKQQGASAAPPEAS